MTLMERRRALMGGRKPEIPITLVNGTYESTVTVTNGNTVAMQPLPRKKNVTIPLTRPVAATETIALKTSTIIQKVTYWYAAIEGIGNIPFNDSNNKPRANRWYERTQGGTITALILKTTESDYNLTADFSLKIDGKVIF